jgi:hypothetical protein
MTELTAQAPDEIDAQIFANLQTIWTAEATRERLLHSMHSIVGDKKVYGWNRGERQGRWQRTDGAVLESISLYATREDYTGAQAAKALDEYNKCQGTIRAARGVNRVLEDEYGRRNGWTRAYLVDTADGHVHKTTSCPSWNRGLSGTRFHWLTELSGQDEAAIVELAGERACTICYPSAPVDTLKRPSKLEGPAQRAQREAREQRDAAKAAKAALQVLDPVTDKVLFKSDRAATNAIAERLSSLCWYGESHPSAQEWLTDIKKIRVALAAKGVAYDYDKALANTRKRVAREAQSESYPKF